ncbi:glycosyl hydrolase family 18 protein [Aquimarina aquimarini]|uniref:glycosyl hydrolase family 18 protein n=1 Tax=Aquimarina aquimarini TaxID=1191734 RepID=UPI000D55DB76|nr:glycosyl hydrolase family 18 protein [Aquimarina aquimarini]
MKSFYTFFSLFFCVLFVQAQYNFPTCAPAWSAANVPYTQGQEASVDGKNYRCKYYTNDQPGAASWELVSPCGDGGLGPGYAGKQKIIGYLPTWIAKYDIKNNFNPEVVTHLNIAFLLFKQNNQNYNSNDFASVAFDQFHVRKVDSVLTDLGVLQKARAKNVKVSVALGGATDFAFLWLMNKYHNNDAKLEQIATLIADYVSVNQLDGVDLDMECWWADPNIAGTSDQGGRVRGSKWGDADQGPHPAGIGLRKLSQKLRVKMPNKLITAAVFGTSWYGNNYDDGIADYMDWVGLMSYDFTGSWDASPEGPHSSLYKVPTGTYQGQTADNPIYSAEDALEYWMGFAPPAWNHAGGFNVPKAKLAFGVPMYGYDFSEKKPDGGNGAKFVPYNEILEEFPNAATSYDPKDTKKLSGFIGEKNKKIYFDTPKSAGAKMKYSKDYGHQGLIIWELTQDANYNSSSSILKAINEAAGNNNTINNPPTVTWQSPTNNQIIEVAELSPVTLQASATDSDGTVQSFTFKHNNTPISATANGSNYTATFTPTAFGEVTLVASATDNKNATSEKTIVFTVKKKGTGGNNVAPTVNITAPVDNASFNVGDPISITANATDSDGTVTKVEFYNGTVMLGEDTTAPYEYTWQNVAAGNYSITAKATDNQTASTTSTAIAITVTEVGTGSCAGIAQYVAGTSYGLNEEVTNTGEKFSCDIPGWCSSAAAWAYAPGTGAHWEMAWTKTGVCTTALEASKYSLYPTVTQDVVNLSVHTENASLIKVDVYHISGKLIDTQSFNGGNAKTAKSLVKDLSNLKNGLYIFKIHVDNNVYFEKVLKK